MFKTISVTLAGLVFHVEEPAYEQLKKYLDSVKSHFATYEDSSEIITDIEARIAERFSGKVSKAKNVINSADVDEVVKAMGTVSEMDGEESVPRKEIETSQVKRFFRDPDSRVLGGVASGVASYFGIDPTIVRVLFVVLAFVWGASVFVYILLWLVMPEARTAGQKLEMKGEPMTISKIEAKIKKTVMNKEEQAKISGNAKKALAAPLKVLGSLFLGLGKVLKVFGLVLAVIVGAALAIAGIVSAIFLTVIMVTLIFNPTSTFVDFPLTDIAQGTLEYTILVAVAYLISLVPVLFLAVAGTSLIKRKSTIRPQGAVAMLGVWVVALAIAGVVSAQVGPEYKAKYDELVAEEQQNEKVYEIAEIFDRINIGGGHKVNVILGEEISVVAFGSERALGRLGFRVVEGQLRSDSNYLNEGRICIFCFRRPASIEITVPELSAVKLSGAVNATVAPVSTDEFEIALSGAAELDIDLAVEQVTIDMSGASHLTLAIIDAQELDLETSGASRATLSGSAEKLTAIASGASHVVAGGLQILQADVRASGASSLDLNVAEEISAELSGASHLDYTGDAVIIKQDISSASHLRFVE